MKHNEAEGGDPFSSHCVGFAADLVCVDSKQRKLLMLLACLIFRRVGYKNNMIHVDIDPTKDQDVLFNC